MSGSSRTVNSKSAVAKGIAKSNGKMVESVIRHPFLTWLCDNTNDQVGCLFPSRGLRHFAGLSDQINDRDRLFAQKSPWGAIPPVIDDSKPRAFFTDVRFQQ